MIHKTNHTHTRTFTYFTLSNYQHYTHVQPSTMSMVLYFGIHHTRHVLSHVWMRALWNVCGRVTQYSLLASNKNKMDSHLLKEIFVPGRNGKRKIESENCASKRYHIFIFFWVQVLNFNALNTQRNTAHISKYLHRRTNSKWMVNFIQVLVCTVRPYFALHFFVSFAMRYEASQLKFKRSVSQLKT